MKKIKFTCSHCGVKLRVPTHLAGVSAPCPKCGSSITAPMDITLAVEDSPTDYGSDKGSAQITTRSAKTIAPSPAITQASIPPRLQGIGGGAPSLAAHSEYRSSPNSLHPTSLPTLTPTSVITREQPGALSAASANPVSASPNVSNPPRRERTPLPDPSIVPHPQTTAPTSIQTAGPSATASRSIASLEDLSSSSKQSPDDLAAVFFGEDVLSSAKTRVFLPTPGSQVTPSRPEDFLSPSFESQVLPPPAVSSEARIYEPTLEDFRKLASAASPAAEMPLDPLDEVSTFENRVVEPSFDSFPSHPSPSLVASPISTPSAPPVSPASALSSIGEIPESLRQPSDFESWMDQRDGNPAITAPPFPRTPSPASELNAPAALEASESILDGMASLREGDFGTLLATQSPILPPELPKFPTSVPDNSNSNVNLGSGLSDEEEEEDNSKSNRTTLIMVISIVAVALLMGIGMIFVINSMLGGLSPGEAYREPADDSGMVSSAKKVDLPRVPTSKATESAPNLSEAEDVKAKSDPPAIHRKDGSESVDAPAVSFDEKVQQTVAETRRGSVIGAPSLDSVRTNPLAPTSPSAPPTGAESIAPTSAPPSTAAPSSTETPPPLGMSKNDDSTAAALLSPLPAGTTAAAPSTTGLQSSAATQKDENYNPAPFFPAPDPSDKSLGKTHDVVDAFLRAPDWQTQSKYAYNGEKLHPMMEDYYKKWPYRNMGRYAINFFTSESDPSLGGPFWVFTISSGEVDSGFPLIVRVEDGHLKVDWDVFSEFFDRRYLRFRETSMPEPASFRVVLEKLSDYYGSDRDQIKDLGDYAVYNVSVPYGGDGEFSDAAFVKKGSEVEKELSKIMKLGEDPLAVTITLEKKAFDSGIKHFIITKLFPEGWIH